MEYNKYIAVEIELNIDYRRLELELMSIADEKWQYDHDPVDCNIIWKSMFLTRNNTKVFNTFTTAKTIPHSDWFWDDSLDIPYTRQIISQLPIRTVGMVRVMWTNGVLPLHVDVCETSPTDLTYNLGLTIAPLLSQPMIMRNDTKIFGKTVLFNDAILHGFPTVAGVQLGIRIFGDFDYQQFNDKIVVSYPI